MKTTLMIPLSLALGAAFCVCATSVKAATPATDITVAAYYFPNYHPTDPRNAKAHGTGERGGDFFDREGALSAAVRTGVKLAETEPAIESDSAGTGEEAEVSDGDRRVTTAAHGVPPR